jgi:hypothetical protein
LNTNSSCKSCLGNTFKIFCWNIMRLLFLDKITWMAYYNYFSQKELEETNFSKFPLVFVSDVVFCMFSQVCR